MGCIVVVGMVHVWLPRLMGWGQWQGLCHWCIGSGLLCGDWVGSSLHKAQTGGPFGGRGP